MQNITRSLTKYEIKAYALNIQEDGTPAIEIVAECEAESSALTKTMARAKLIAASGKPLAKGLTIKWTPKEVVTYAMPLNQFLEGATIISTERVVEGE